MDQSTNQPVNQPANQQTKVIVVGGKTYIIRKFRAIEGRRIVAGYPITAIPKFGDYNGNEEIMLRLMSHVSVVITGRPEGLPLTTRELVDNHVLSWEGLVEIEYEVLKFNCPFLQSENMKPFMEVVKDAAADYLAQIVTKAMQLEQQE